MRDCGGKRRASEIIRSLTIKQRDIAGVTLTAIVQRDRIGLRDIAIKQGEKRSVRILVLRTAIVLERIKHNQGRLIFFNFIANTE